MIIRLLHHKLIVRLLSRVWLFATSWIAAYQASLSFTISQSSIKLMSIESMMPSNHLILCHPLCLLPSIFPSISCGLPILNFCSLGEVPHELGWGLQDLDTAETEKYTLVYSPWGVCFSILTTLPLLITFTKGHGPYFNWLETKNYQVGAGMWWWDMRGTSGGMYRTWWI